MSSPIPPVEDLLQQRSIAISQSLTVTGLDFVQFIPGSGVNGQLALHFIAKPSLANAVVIPPNMTMDNITITPNTPTAFSIQAINYPANGGNVLTLPVQVNSNLLNFLLDSTTYDVSLTDPSNSLDPFLNSAKFSISSNAQAQIDSLQNITSNTLRLTSAPEIDYLSRDFLSFRQLMLNRLSTLIPDWQASNTADLGNVVVEILAYVADYLSYYQDAVVTEGYLETARQRLSVKRHTRLLDYSLSEGCNSRVWVHVEVANPKIQLPAKTLLLTGSTIPPGVVVVSTESGSPYRLLMNDDNVIQFATLYATQLYANQNKINFYTWGGQEVTLPVGTTSTSLEGAFDQLVPGDVLMFEQVLSPDTGLPEDADSTQRWIVRLTSVAIVTDALYAQQVTEISWNQQDALPFPVVISSIINGAPVKNISQARGNMVLADQGRFIYGEALIPAVVPDQGLYRPKLHQTNLTFSQAFDLQSTLADPASIQSAASKATQQTSPLAVPVITLEQTQHDISTHWNPKPDLLSSNYLSQNFVVEMDDERVGHLRFGDNTFGEKPAAGSSFTASYRIGNGSVGNIGANSLAYVVIDTQNPSYPAPTSIISIYNPLPGQGGTDPETITQAKLYAPKAFQQQERCVTLTDYVTVVKQYPEVVQANAILRWTGSWNTVFIAVQLSKGVTFNQTYETGLLNYLSQFQLLNQDIKVMQAQSLPLNIALGISLKPGYLFNVVNRNLMQVFSDTLQPDGNPGFFYPGRFGIGQPLYLSDIVLAIIDTPGVAAVDITHNNPETKFQIYNDKNSTALDDQVIQVGPLQVIQVDNDFSHPEQGIIQFFLSNSTADTTS